VRDCHFVSHTFPFGAPTPDGDFLTRTTLCLPTWAFAVLLTRATGACFEFKRLLIFRATNLTVPASLLPCNRVRPTKCPLFSRRLHISPANFHPCLVLRPSVCSVPFFPRADTGSTPVTSVFFRPCHTSVSTSGCRVTYGFFQICR
jgi:hypothetical protein